VNVRGGRQRDLDRPAKATLPTLVDAPRELGRIRDVHAERMVCFEVIVIIENVVVALPQLDPEVDQWRFTGQSRLRKRNVRRLCAICESQTRCGVPEVGQVSRARPNAVYCEAQVEVPIVTR